MTRATEGRARPLRVAFVVGAFPLPSETFITAQIAGLLGRGHDVRVLATLLVDNPAAEAELPGLRARTVASAPCPRPWLARALSGAGLLLRGLTADPAAALAALDVRKHGRAALSLALLHEAAPLWPRQRFDVIHAHFGSSALRALRLRDAGTIAGPLLTTFHGHDVTLLPRLWGPHLYRDLFARGEAFTVNTRYTGGKVEALGGPPERIETLPMGVDLGRVIARRQPRAPGGPRLLAVGRLVEKKGTRFAIEALARVLPRHPDATLRVVGDGPLRADLEARAGALGLLVPRPTGAPVTFLGARTADEVRALYAASDLLVHACVTATDGDQEGQGLVLQEAQAAGLPVLATRHNGLPEGVLDGQSGTLVPEGDTDALAAALGALLDRPDSWPQLGEAGRRFVTERYDQRRLIDQLEALYQRLATPG